MKTCAICNEATATDNIKTPADGLSAAPGRKCENPCHTVVTERFVMEGGFRKCILYAPLLQ